jgi:hypothetical protein
MADLNRLTGEESILEEPRKMPEMINVLTILTFIGSGIGILTNLWYFSSAKKFYDMTVANQDKVAQAPSFVRGLQGSDPVGVAQRTYDNRVPIVVLGMVALILCIIGAVQMRKLKKTGFYIYLIGEVLPIISSFIFIGVVAYTGVFQVIGALLFPTIFIILYATQLKYLKN